MTDIILTHVFWLLRLERGFRRVVMTAHGMAKAVPLNHLVWRVLSVLAVLVGLAALTTTAQVVQPKAPEGQTAPTLERTTPRRR